jgi:hypothetical protein
MRIDRVPRRVLGYTVFEARRVYVFYDCVVAASERENRPALLPEQAQAIRERLEARRLAHLIE